MFTASEYSLLMVSCMTCFSFDKGIGLTTPKTSCAYKRTLPFASPQHVRYNPQMHVGKSRRGLRDTSGYSLTNPSYAFYDQS